jgi:hypothetical protein
MGFRFNKVVLTGATGEAEMAYEVTSEDGVKTEGAVAIVFDVSGTKDVTAAGLSKC